MVIVGLVDLKGCFNQSSCMLTIGSSIPLKKYLGLKKNPNENVKNALN